MAVQVETIDHTADIGLVVRAGTAAEAFGATAEAMFDFMVNRDGVTETRRQAVHVEGKGWEDLLVVWLEELLYLYESGGFALHKCRIVDLSPDHLKAEIAGEPLDRTRHEVRVQIKAVTYHQLRAEETDTGFLVRVIFDI